MLKFTKMHGLGNDFVVIDAIHQTVELSAEKIQDLADRNFGIGFDQLLLVEKPVSEDAEFKYRIFNADGSEVSQCGNGARCFARFVRDKGLTQHNDIRVDTNAGQLVLHLTEDGLVTVNMGVPRHDPHDIPLLMSPESISYELIVEGKFYRFGAVSMGNPHAVLIVDDIRTAPVAELGKQLESHAIFPERANIGFMQIINPEFIKLRVYERGAAETLACGSGACGAVVVGIEQGYLSDKVTVELPGGRLTIAWQGRGTPVMMAGEAVSVFEGTIAL